MSTCLESRAWSRKGIRQRCRHTHLLAQALNQSFLKVFGEPSDKRHQTHPSGSSWLLSVMPGQSVAGREAWPHDPCQCSFRSPEIRFLGSHHYPPSHWEQHSLELSWLRLALDKCPGPRQHRDKAVASMAVHHHHRSGSTEHAQAFNGGLLPLSLGNSQTKSNAGDELAIHHAQIVKIIPKKGLVTK